MVADTNGNGAPNFGDEITYNVSTSATAYPYVSTQCYQGRTHVLSASAGYYPSYAWPGAETVALQSGAWTGGGASCTATLYSMDSGSQATLATLSYTVGA
jgi:hypothetical protein